MPVIKTEHLMGAALNWVVAKCEGVRMEDVLPPRWKGASLELLRRDENGKRTGHYVTGQFNYCTGSTQWEWGGPIIEREGISIGKGTDGWAAFINVDDEDGHLGATPLVAAMRCYVASKIGDEVDVPERFLEA